jgi:hypothetical protein
MPRRLLNLGLRPRPIAQRTSEFGRYVKGYQHFLYLSRCEERYRTGLMRRVGWTMVRYTPSRRKHPAYRGLNPWWKAKRRRADSGMSTLVVVSNPAGATLFSGSAEEYALWKSHKSEDL